MKYLFLIALIATMCACNKDNTPPAKYSVQLSTYIFTSSGAVAINCGRVDWWYTADGKKTNGQFGMSAYLPGWSGEKFEFESSAKGMGSCSPTATLGLIISVVDADGNLIHRENKNTSTDGEKLSLSYTTP
jgi:hypothetical protein